jgi:hypothetical protein
MPFFVYKCQNQINPEVNEFVNGSVNQFGNRYQIQRFPELVNRRRRDNTMAKRKSTKGQTTIYKTYM